MDLLSCPGCSKKIDVKNQYCPHCRFILKESLRKKMGGKYLPTEHDRVPRSSGRGSLGGVFFYIFGMLAGGFGLWMFAVSKSVLHETTAAITILIAVVAFGFGRIIELIESLRKGG